MDDYTSARVKLAIREDIIKGEDWTDARLLDGVKQKFPECSPEEVDALYTEELRARIEAMSEAELRGVLDDQCALAPAERNFCLLTLALARLG